MKFALIFFLLTSFARFSFAQEPTTPADVADLLTEEEPTEVDKEPTPLIRKKKERIDPISRQESRFIEHPNAKKGLIRIDKDKVYHYAVESSKQSKAASIKLGTYEPSDLANPDNTDLTFDLIYYKSSSPLITYDQETQFTQRFGKLAWKWGTGLFSARGTGQFETPQADEPREKFSLFVIPLNIGLIYRAKYFENQFIVPYAEAAGGVFLFAEYRDDGQNPGIGAALGAAPMAHFSFGGSIPLGRSARSFLDLDREYGINSVSIDVEFRSYLALGDYDFADDVISVGFSAQY